MFVLWWQIVETKKTRDNKKENNIDIEK